MIEKKKVLKTENTDDLMYLAALEMKEEISTLYQEAGHNIKEELTEFKVESVKVETENSSNLDDPMILGV